MYIHQSFKSHLSCIMYIRVDFIGDFIKSTTTLLSIFRIHSKRHPLICYALLSGFLPRQRTHGVIHTSCFQIHFLLTQSQISQGTFFSDICYSCALYFKKITYKQDPDKDQGNIPEVCLCIQV